MQERTPSDICFFNLLKQLTMPFDFEEGEGRSVTAEIKHRDMDWVWRGQPGFVGFQLHGDRNVVWRFDRETGWPVIWS